MKKGWFRYITGLFLILVWNIALFSFWSFFLLVTWILILPMDFIYIRVNKRTPEIHLELPYQVPKEKVAVGTIHIKESSFLKGQNNKNWTITFDWLIKPSNFIKVLEGNYTDKEDGSNARNIKKDNRTSEKPKYDFSCFA